MLSFTYESFYPPQFAVPPLHTFSAWVAPGENQPIKADSVSAVVQTIQRFHSMDLLVPEVMMSTPKEV